MIPIADENPTIRTPWMTIGILAVTFGMWILVQGAGLSELELAASVCNLGLVPGELTGRAPVGMEIPISGQWACVVDRESINWLTPLSSIFLHGSWGHILGNALFFWVFGNNVEDVMGRARFGVFYLACGLAAGIAHILFNSGSNIPTVGASGAISGVMGGYLLLFPRNRVYVLTWGGVATVPAVLMLGLWIVVQFVNSVGSIAQTPQTEGGGVAYLAHVGGFVAGLALAPLFSLGRRVRGV